MDDGQSFMTGCAWTSHHMVSFCCCPDTGFWDKVCKPKSGVFIYTQSHSSPASFQQTSRRACIWHSIKKPALQTQGNAATQSTHFSQLSNGPSARMYLTAQGEVRRVHSAAPARDRGRVPQLWGCKDEPGPVQTSGDGDIQGTSLVMVLPSLCVYVFSDVSMSVSIFFFFVVWLICN